MPACLMVLHVLCSAPFKGLGTPWEGSAMVSEGAQMHVCANLPKLHPSAPSHRYCYRRQMLA